MHCPDWLAAIILGIVEGLTEFLPISSTGHLIVAGKAVGYDHELFDVVIQLGALGAVWWIFRKKIMEVLSLRTEANRRVSLNLLIGFLPAGILGFLFHKWIVQNLFSPRTVALSLIAGGLAILLIERRFYHPHRESTEKITNKHALLVGLAQCLALIPGVSRSGATILGGLMCGLSRPVAAEFSFLLAMPTMVAAGVFELSKHWHELNHSILRELVIGLLISYVSAWIVVKWFIRFIQRHTFVGFAWYRIIFGVLLLGLIYLGYLG